MAPEPSSVATDCFPESPKSRFEGFSFAYLDANTHRKRLDG